jgi:hypothetical protein
MQATHWYMDPVSYSITPLFGLQDLQKTTSFKTVHLASGKILWNMPEWSTGEIKVQEIRELIVFREFIFDNEDAARTKRDQLLSALEVKPIGITD